METLTLKSKNIILRAVKESDIDDRLKIGCHNEFVHMCGGDSFVEEHYPDRSHWEK